MKIEGEVRESRFAPPPPPCGPTGHARGAVPSRQLSVYKHTLPPSPSPDFPLFYSSPAPPPTRLMCSKRGASRPRRPNRRSGFALCACSRLCVSTWATLFRFRLLSFFFFLTHRNTLQTAC